MHIKTFEQISKEDINIAGGKGASLGEMASMGISVPFGFVILASAFERFLEEADLGAKVEAIIKKADHNDISSIDKASSEIRHLISEAKIPNDIEKEIIEGFADSKMKFVAVRSSATAEDSLAASWAGEFETYLNVTQKNLLDSVKRCWSSFFTSRAIFYRAEKRLNKQKASMAVVVQKMVQSEIAGTCFTAHPVSKDRSQIIIEAGFGLGEAIASGKITPDTYVVEKPNGKKQMPKIIDKNISEQRVMIVKSNHGNKEAIVPKTKRLKQKLADKEIIKLAKICIDIENHYKKPQDIEWAFEKKKFYIIQSRPITTL